jgi:outer membrane protein TolC
MLEAHAEARHLHTVVLPLRQQVLDETLRQYNAMNASTFELLTARRELVEGGRQYIDALRRYHNAAATVRALGRGGIPPTSTDQPTVSATGAAAAEH